MKLYLVVLLITFVEISFAQTNVIKISGIIHDSSKTPISGAIVKIKKDTSQQAIVAYNLTNKQGYYELTFKNQMDSLWLEVSAIGFNTYYKHFSSSQIEHKNIDVILQHNYRFLPPVDVKTIPPITQNKDTISFNVNAFNKNNASNLESLLKTMPGFQIADNGSLLFNGKIIDKVLIEKDDLFGNDYTTLTQNINPDNLEQIQIINNYKDEADLSQTGSKGNKQVLNLKFKKNKLAKVFGDVTVSVPVNRYEEKLNAISLIPKAKFVLLSNANSIGNLTLPLLNAKYDIKNITASNNKATTLQPAINIPDINIANNFDKSRVMDNKSWLNQFNSQFNISKRFKLKSKIQLNNDAFSQYYSQTQNYFNATNPITITEENNINKEIFGTLLEVNPTYTLGSKFQATYNGLFHYNKANNQVSGYIYNTPLMQVLNQKLVYGMHSLKLIFILFKKEVITVDFNYENGKLPQQFSFNPFIADSLFQLNKPYNSAYENTNNNQENFSIKANYHTTLKKGQSIGFNSGFTYNKERFNSNLYAFNNFDSLYLLNSSFQNTSHYNNHSFFVEPFFTANINKYFTYTLSTSLLYQQLKQNSNTATNFSKMYLLPNVEIAYQPNTKNIFSISYSSNNNLPSIKNLLYGFSFTQFLSLRNGSTNLNIGRTNTFLLSYTYLDLFRNGILLSIGSFYNQIYEPYITASSSSGPYLIQKELINEDKLLGNNIAFYGYAEKLIKPIKSQIKLNTSYYTGESYAIYNASLQQNSTKGFKLKVQYNSVFEKGFNFSIISIYQRNSFKNQLFNNNESSTLFGQLELHYKFAKKFQINYNLNYNSLNSNVGTSNNIFLNDAGILWKPENKKYAMYCTVKNIFNQSNFSNNSITPYFFSSSQYQLLRRFVLFSLQYKF
jgi:hypothetical protein